LEAIGEITATEISLDVGKRQIINGMKSFSDFAEFFAGENNRIRS
jgi:hypothetical protein